MLHVATGSFTKTWMPIKEDWASCYKNRTDQQQARNHEWQDKERTFKVRQFSEFFVVLHVLRGEHTHSHVMQRVKTPAIPNNWLTSDDVMYATYATPYAYYYALIEKLLLRDAVTVSEDGRPFQSSEGVISTMASSCQCSLWITGRQPCWHIFAIFLHRFLFPQTQRPCRSVTIELQEVDTLDAATVTFTIKDVASAHESHQPMNLLVP